MENPKLPVSPRRKAGRPPASVNNRITRNSIIETAYELTSDVALQDVSIVMVAKALLVTPALIHYYIGGRDGLTSGVMNTFYRNLIAAWPKETGQAEADILEAAFTIYQSFIDRPGIAAYAIQNNRFRVFQLLEPGDTDFGVELVERFAGRVRLAGCSAERTGIYSHMMMEFIISSAYGAVRHRYPTDHREFLQSRIARLDPARYPNIAFTSQFPLNLDADTALREGLKLFLLGLRAEQLPTDTVVESVLNPVGSDG